MSAAKEAPPAALCRCGHAKAAHHHGRGLCGTQPGATNCSCGRYAAANKAIPLSPALRLATGKKTRPAKSKGIVANLPHAKKSLALAKVQTQGQGMAWLRRRVPSFFKDPVKVAMAAEVIRRMPEEMAKLTPVDRAGAIATIMGLMYDMAKANTQYIRSDGSESMGEIFLANCQAERNAAAAADSQEGKAP